MKKTTLITTLALSGLVLAGLAPTTQAANPPDLFPSTTTEGSLNFKTVGPTDEGEVTKPDTEDEIVVPDEGGSTTGPLRMTHVPNFDFGAVQIQTKDLKSSAIFETIKATDPSGAAVGDSLEIAHFAQVEDIRGTKDGWSLSLKAGKFIPSDKVKNVTLEKSHIILDEAQLFNTVNQNDVNNRVSMLEVGKPLDTADNGAATTIMKVKAGKHTDSSKTSIVFNDKYAHDNMVGGVPDPAAGESRRNPGVTIVSAGTDEKAVNETYTATLLWTLTAGY